jgi:RNA polymerase-binding transcription factor DksA
VTAKKPTKKSAGKKTAKKVAAKKATQKAASGTKASAKKAPAKKVAKKAASATKAPAKKSTAKKSTAKAGTKSAAATKKAASAPTKKASKSSARKATAKKNVAKSNTASAGSDAARVIPPEYDYLHDKKWLDSQREALLRERASYTSSADRLAAEAAALMADREPGDVQFDEESGEGDTIAVERDRDLALSAAARQSVAEIDAALERLDNNTYGLCVAGDDVIPRERLEAIPEASVCVTHKTSMF